MTTVYSKGSYNIVIFIPRGGSLKGVRGKNKEIEENI